MTIDAAPLISLALARGEPVVRLGPGSYYLDRPRPIHRSLAILGAGRHETRLTIHDAGSIGIGLAPFAVPPIDPGHLLLWMTSPTTGDRWWLAAPASPATLGRHPDGWAEVRQLTVAMAFHLPRGIAPVGTYLCAADAWDRPHLLLTHWGEGRWTLRTTTGGTHRWTRHDVAFALRVESELVELTIDLDLDLGMAAVSATGATVGPSVTTTPPIPPGARLRGCLLAPLLIGAVSAGIAEDRPDGWFLPDHGSDWAWGLAGLRLGTEAGPLASLQLGPDRAALRPGPGVGGDLPCLLVGPAARDQPPVEWFELADLEVEAKYPWASPLLLGSARGLRIDRVEFQGEPARWLATLGTGATYRHRIRDCSFWHGWDAAIVGDQVILAVEDCDFNYPGRHAIRGRGSALMAHDGFWHGPTAWTEHLVLNLGGENGWLTDVRRPIWDHEFGSPVRSLVHHEASLYRPNRLIVEDLRNIDVPCSLALVELSRPDLPESYRVPCRADINRCYSTGAQIVATDSDWWDIAIDHRQFPGVI